jgi:hypothetical protein
MIATPTRDRDVISARTPGPSAGAFAPIGAPALSRSAQATTRPVVTESRQGVGEILLLTRYRQK